MTTLKLLMTIAATLVLLGCSRSANKQKEMAKADADTVAPRVFISSSAAIENKMDTTHKFIRTADLKFRVKSVINATYDIENIATQQGGFVTFSDLVSNISNVTTVPVSSDSSLVSTYYTVSNSIILRVPNTRLDSVLKMIAKKTSNSLIFA